jgi:hypothetical protein
MAGLGVPSLRIEHERLGARWSYFTVTVKLAGVATPLTVAVTVLVPVVAGVT